MKVFLITYWSIGLILAMTLDLYCEKENFWNDYMRDFGIPTVWYKILLKISIYYVMVGLWALLVPVVCFAVFKSHKESK